MSLRVTVTIRVTDSIGPQAQVYAESSHQSLTPPLKPGMDGELADFGEARLMVERLVVDCRDEVTGQMALRVQHVIERDRDNQ